MTRPALLGKLESASLRMASEFVSLEIMGSRSRWLRGLLTNRTGAITVEYAMLVGLVGITGAAALLTFGPAIASAYAHTRGMLLLPIP
jgi:Flp pilus assembly pilin Flp